MGWSTGVGLGLTLLETLDFPTEYPAGYTEISAGNLFPADFAKDLDSAGKIYP